MNTLTVGSLFSGIGGIDLGLERAGFRIAWQCEIDAYCQKVLTKHWPDVTRYGDIRTVGKHNLQAVDLLTGGFPCQDISNAGKRAGIEGERSGLWSEFYRLICELRPSFVLVENVAALLARGIDTVLGDLASCGYDAEWQVLSAEAVGAPHLRERVFIVAYASSTRARMEIHRSSGQRRQSSNTSQPAILRQEYGEISAEGINASCQDVADTCSTGRRGRQVSCHDWQETSHRSLEMANPDLQGLEVGQVFGRDAQQKLTAFKRSCSTESGQWAVEPAIRRVAHGIPSRVDRLKGLGNAVVPQIAEYIGRCILASIEEREQAS